MQKWKYILHEIPSKRRDFAVCKVLFRCYYFSTLLSVLIFFFLSLDVYCKSKKSMKVLSSIFTRTLLEDEGTLTIDNPRHHRNDFFLDWACRMHLCKVSKLIFILAFYLTLLLALACCFIHLTLNTQKKRTENINILYMYSYHNNAKGIAFDEKYLASLCVMIIYHCSKSGNVNGCARFTWVWIGKKKFLLANIIAVKSDTISFVWKSHLWS